MTRPAFTRDRISDFELFDRHAEIVIGQLKTRLHEGYPVDFQDLMSRFTLDSATEFLFGHCVHSLKAGLPYPFRVDPSFVPDAAEIPETRLAKDFSAAFFEAQYVIGQRERLGPVWPLFEIFRDKAKEPMKTVNDFIEPIIADAIRKKNMATQEDKDSHLSRDSTLLDQLVQVTSDPKILKDET